MFQNDPKQFKQIAELDRNNTSESMGTGVYECFCKEATASGEDSLCSDYKNHLLEDQLIAQVVSFSIIAGNLVLRAVVIILIRYIGYYTES